MALAGLDHCVVCTAAADKVLVRHYHIGFQRSGSKVRCDAVRRNVVWCFWMSCGVPSSRSEGGVLRWDAMRCDGCHVM